MVKTLCAVVVAGVMALWVALWVYSRTKRWQVAGLVIPTSTQSMTLLHSPGRGFVPCNPSVVWSPDKTTLWCTYRETNLHFGGSMAFMRSALRWKTRIGFAMYCPTTMRCIYSTLLRETPDAACPRGPVTGYHDPRLFVLPRTGECFVLAYRMVRTRAQMMLLTLRPIFSGKTRITKAMPLVATFDQPETPQKNWNVFLHHDEPLVVIRVLPLQIGSIDFDTGKVYKLYQTTYQPLRAYKKRENVRVHGGSTLVQFLWMKQPALLGALHFKRGSPLLHGFYQTVLFVCNAQPPFQIVFASAPFCFDTLRHSRKCESIQLASGLASIPPDDTENAGDVVLTMGVMDAEMMYWRYPKQKLAAWIQDHPLQV